ncbi:MAG: hypothetical protein AB7E55_36465, partial [Pigmentiphaga sp.]
MIGVDAQHLVAGIESLIRPAVAEKANGDGERLLGLAMAATGRRWRPPVPVFRPCRWAVRGHVVAPAACGSSAGRCFSAPSGWVGGSPVRNQSSARGHSASR